MYFGVLFQKFNVEEKEVHRAILSGDPHDQLYIAYNLIIDNKRLSDGKKDMSFYLNNSSLQ